MGVKIVDITPETIRDLFKVCSDPSLRDEALKKGISIKKKWLLDMLRKYGHVAKIGYLNNRPVAQILFYPGEADPAGYARKDVLVIHCVYNPFSQAQRRGMAKALVKSLINDAKQWGYKFLAVYAFETGEYYSQRAFFVRLGFKLVPGGSPCDLYYPLGGGVLSEEAFNPWRDMGETVMPISEDQGKAFIFYAPTCEYGYVFALKTAETIRSLAPDIEINLVNYWENPAPFLARGKRWLLVNGVPIESSPLDIETFREEVRRAASLRRL